MRIGAEFTSSIDAFVFVRISVYCVCVVQNMSAIETSRHIENVTFPVDATESVARVTASAASEDNIWWQWLVVDHVLRYGPALCVCSGTVGIALSIVVWIRLQRHLPATLLYILLAMMLELLPLYMHCGSYTLKQVILCIYSSLDRGAEMQGMENARNHLHNCRGWKMQGKKILENARNRKYKK